MSDTYRPVQCRVAVQVFLFNLNGRPLQQRVQNTALTLSCNHAVKETQAG